MSLTTVAIADGEGTEVIVGRIDARRPDLALVEALARLQLLARRRGWRLCVRDVPEELHGLAELVGLADGLGLEPGREPERGEQLEIEEVVQADDPLA